MQNEVPALPTNPGEKDAAILPTLVIVSALEHESPCIMFQEEFFSSINSGAAKSMHNFGTEGL